MRLRHAIAIAAVWAAAYGASLWFYFLADTFDLIANAQAVGGEGLAAFFVSPIGKFYRPLTQLSLLADLRLWGLRPAGFHLTNLVAGLGTALLVWALAHALLPGRPRAALAAGLLFALYPLHPQAVTWIAGRNDLLCAFFYLAALLLLVRGAAAGLTLAAGALFALALLCKEMAISFPIAAFVAVAMAPGRRVARGLGVGVGMTVVAACYVLARSRVIGTVLGGYGVGEHLQLSPGALFYGLERPLYALLKPVTLAGRLDLWLEAPLALAAVAVIWRGWTPALGRALLWLGISLLPILTLRVGVTDARLLYLPSAFFCLAAALAAARIAERGRWRPAVAACLVAVGLVYADGLAREQVLWGRAAGLARRLVGQVGGLPVDLDRDRLYFVDFPHHYGPVPTFATGLPRALQLEYGRPHLQAVPLARLVLTPGGAARVHVQVVHRRTIALTAEPPAWFFVWGSRDEARTEHLGGAAVTVSEGRQEALIRLSEPLDPGRDRLIAYSGRDLRLVRLPGGR